MKLDRRSRDHRRRGAAAAELALILPVLLTIALACVDFGRFAYHHIAITNASRAGAEYGSTNSYWPSNASAWQNGVQTAARDELTNQTNCTPSDLTTTTTVTHEGNGFRRVRVAVSYASFTTLVSWPGIPDTITMTAATEMRMIR